MAELNQNCKCARQLYMERLSDLGLPENPEDSNKYDWNLMREFYNWLKQINANSEYVPSFDELRFLEEIQCFVILKEIGVKTDPHEERDWVIAVLEQRIDIRDSVLMPDDYCTIDNRMPLKIVSNDEAMRLYRLINPDGYKDFNLIPLPVNNYYNYKSVPSGTEAAKSESVKSSEPVGQGATDGEILNTHHLPIEQYGKLAKALINEFAQGFRVPKDMIAAMILVLVGAACNKKISLRTWNFVNYASLWIAIVLRSGDGKSESQSRLEKPLRDINQDLLLQFNKIYSDWVSSGSKGTPPVKRKLIVDDTTPEVLYSLLSAQGLYLSRDELSGLFADFGRYHQGSELERYLSIFSNKSFSVDRVNASSFEIQHPFMSILGGIQPERLADAFGKKEFDASGFLARWQFVVSTESKVPDSASEVLINKDVENQWYALILGLWKMERKEFRLSPDAARGYQGYMKKTAAIMNAQDCEDGVRGMYAKLRIVVLRIALILHVLRNGVKAADEIDIKTMDAAILTADCFAYWGKQARSLIRGSETKKTISNADLLREFADRFKITNQSELARLIGRSQQYVSKTLNINNNNTD